MAGQEWPEGRHVRGWRAFTRSHGLLGGLGVWGGPTHGFSGSRTRAGACELPTGILPASTAGKSTVGNSMPAAPGCVGRPAAALPRLGPAWATAGKVTVA